MRLAIIADIHGNISALEAVLHDLAKSSFDKVVVNGDMVNRGPHSVEVMERLWEHDFDYTLGNHDDLMRLWVEKSDKIPQHWFGDPFWRATEIAAKSLEKNGWLEAIRQMPMFQKIEVPGAPSLLVSHGSPRHYREGYGAFTKEEVFSELTAEYDADVFIGSHTHRTWEDRFHGKRFVNTGAVGAPFNSDPRAQYLILTLEAGDWRFEFRKLEYDRAATIDSYTDSGFLENGLLSAEIFREEVRHATPLYDPFWRWADKHNLPRDSKTWEKFKRRFPERFDEK